MSQSKKVRAAAVQLSPVLYSREGTTQKVSDAVGRGARLVVVEPIAKRDRPWWPDWAERLTGLGAREDECRFPASLPTTTRQIAKSAGLNPRELTARTLIRL